MLGIGVTSVIYLVGTISVMGMIPGKDLQHSVTPFTDAAILIWGSPARYWVSAGIAIAAFGALNGWILIQGQMPYAIAKDKLFPPAFARENKKGVPARGLIVSSIFVSLLLYMNYTRGLVEQFKFLILLTTLSVLVPYLFSTASYIIIRLQDGFLKKSTQSISAIVLSILAFLFAIWLIIGSGQEIVYWGFVLLMAGIPFYVWIIWKKNP
jgi:APA family basic amino acid/polyamine antiporter